MKWAPLALFLLVILIPLGFYFKGSVELIKLEPVIEDTQPLLLGVIPYIQPKILKNHMSPVYEYLSQKIGRPVCLNTVSDYESLAKLLEMGKIQLAWFSHASYTELKKNNKWEVLCRPYKDNGVVYNGQIIARQDSGIEKISDLKGKTFAYVDRFSGSGFFFPNRLFAKNGIKPLEFFSNVVFTHSHIVSIEGVLKGDFDAASVFSTDLLVKNSDGGKQIKIIALTEPIPNDPLVVRSDMEAGLKEKIKNAMLKMDSDPDGKAYIDRLIKQRGYEKFVTEEEVQKILQGNTSER